MKLHANRSISGYSNALKRLFAMNREYCVFKTTGFIRQMTVALCILFSIQRDLCSQIYAYDRDGRSTGAVVANGSQANYAYDDTANISNIYPSTVQDTNVPIILISNPLPGIPAASSPLVVNGTVFDANKLIFVLYSVNGGSWQLDSKRFME